MEALFNKMDVRNLLSAQDISDPATPLSAPDLRLLISRLDSQSQQIQSQIQSYLLSHHRHFSSLFSVTNDAVSQSNQISASISDLLHLISDRPIDVEIRQIIEEIKGKAREVKVKKELLELVQVIVEISERLRSVKEGLRNGQLKFVAAEVRELKKAVRVCETEEGEPVVYGLLRNEWTECFDEIQELLGRLLENAVQFERETNIVRVKYLLSVSGIDGVDLRSVLEAMDEVGILDYGLSKVGYLMINHVITSVINCGSTISFVEESNQDVEDMAGAILKIVPSPDRKFQIENTDGETIFREIIQVIKFICKYICLGNGYWIQCIGRLTWPRISELIISNFLSKVVPEDSSKLSNFQNIIKVASEFETALKEMMFISASDNKEERLSNFAENVEVHFASRKKTEILAKARSLLLQCDFVVPKDYSSGVNSSDRVVDLLFLSGRCVVSEAASQLMKLVHQTLRDVCLSSTRVALEFYHAARDAVLLYEAVIPLKLEKQLDEISQKAVLMHNDCLFLSQEILGLAFEYRSDFPSSIKEHAVFVDMAPRFHVMAEEILQKQIQLVIYNLREAIDGADGFQDTHQVQKLESAKFSIDQVVFTLEKVRMIWEPLLLPSTYQRSMCMVLEAVFSRVTRDILLLDDIAAEETLQLQRLIHLMLESLSSLLASLMIVNRKGKLKEDPVRPLDELIPSLRKIRKLAELLDMPLKSITSAWESGDLLASSFSLPEVRDFVKAIFTDSPLRKECLWRMENVSF